MAAPADGADGAVDQAAAAAGQQDVDYDNKGKLLAPSRRALKAFDLKTAICSATRDMYQCEQVSHYDVSRVLSALTQVCTRELQVRQVVQIPGLVKITAVKHGPTPARSLV
ncbi:unnamed protein product, partial [Prorocentrum cordatum]